MALKFKLAAVSAAALTFATLGSASAMPLIYQGAGSGTGQGGFDSVEQARMDFEAQIANLVVDPLTGLAGSSAQQTSALGNVFDIVPGTGRLSRQTNNTGGGNISGDTLRGDRDGTELQFDWNASGNQVSAIGFNVFDNDGGFISITLNSSTGSERFDFQSVSGSDRVEFFGVVLNTGLINSVTIGAEDPGGVSFWDNFSYGATQQSIVIGPNPGGGTTVSEPATVGLMLAGLAGLGVATRRRKAN